MEPTIRELTEADLGQVFGGGQCYACWAVEACNNTVNPPVCQTVYICGPVPCS